VSEGDLSWLVLGAAAGACIGALLGALAMLALRARREQSLRVQLEVLRAQVKTDEIVTAEREQALNDARLQLQGAFADLARTSLVGNSETFLQLARERLERQQQDAVAALKERESAVDSLVRPIREALARTESQIQSIEHERTEAFASLRSQMETLSAGQNLLSRETRNLVTALRQPQVRGQWGEITLRRLVELSGMTAHADFTEQHHRGGEDGAIRPDMIVHLPGRRDIVVDVKTPLEAYLAAAEAQSDEERSAQLRRHAQVVGARVRELASKQYWAQFEQSPDFAVLFLPGEQFLSAALQENPALLDEALRQNVMLATPSSLVSLLKAVEFGWKQTVLADNAAEVRRLGEDLYRRLAVFGEHLGRLGKSLTGSIDSFNRAVGSLEHQVLPAARRFPELGLRVNREMESIAPVNVPAREPADQAPPSDDGAAPERP
jgi:DNA recombination protein RmuC